MQVARVDNKACMILRPSDQPSVRPPKRALISLQDQYYYIKLRFIYSFFSSFFIVNLSSLIGIAAAVERTECKKIEMSHLETF